MLAVDNVAWYISMSVSMSDAARGCFQVEFQHAIDYLDTVTKLLVHKVTFWNVC